MSLPRPRRAVGRCSALGPILLLLGCAERTPAQSPTSTPASIVARVGGRTITLEEVDKRALLADAGTYAGLRLLYALYEARRAALDEIVTEHLVAQEAQARGIGRDELIDREVTSKTAPVTDQEVEAWYRANPDRVRGAALDQVREPIRQFLAQERRQQALAALIETLKQKSPVTVLLEPPRQPIKVATDEPALGPPHAPVEIVEYSDFQ